MTRKPNKTAIGNRLFQSDQRKGQIVPIASASVMEAKEQNTSPSHFVGQGWQISATALIAIRFVQGWIYWGGGSRRFIYAPQKLDPHAGHWMAYKFQTAMPGALLGTGHIISFMLQHFNLLYAQLVIFSAVELLDGAMLMTGLFTRLAALISVLLAFVLMLLFGWQGATCIDEWTIAASSFAMGVTLFLAGSGSYSLDQVLLRKNPSLSDKKWYRWLSGSFPLPLSDQAFSKLALAFTGITIVFVVSTYSYYRGSVFTPFHGGPVSPANHHVSLSNAFLSTDGSVRVHLYVDAGTPADPMHIIDARLLNKSGHVVEQWDGNTLKSLSRNQFKNDYAYQKVLPSKTYGFQGGVGSKATVFLTGQHTVPVSGKIYRLEFTSINDHHWSIALAH